MKTTNSFSVLFFLKKDKASKGLAPVYVRIAVNIKIVDISLKRCIKVASWDSKLQKIIGSDKEVKDVNNEPMRDLLKQEGDSIILDPNAFAA